MRGVGVTRSMRRVSLADNGISVDWDHSIGHGAFGAAFRGQKGDRPVVVKVCAAENAAAEARFMRRFPEGNRNLPHLVLAGRPVDLPDQVWWALPKGLRASSETTGVVVMDDAGGPISPAFKARCRADYRVAVTFLIALLRGLRGQHRNNILHLDLHGGNIRMPNDDPRSVKIIDYSCSEEMPDAHTAEVFAWKWSMSQAAPERRGTGRKQVRRSADIFAATRIAVSLMNGGSVFAVGAGAGAEEWKQAIAAGPVLPDNLPEGLRRELRRALALDPETRHQYVAPLMKALRPYGLPANEGGFSDAYFRDLQPGA